MARRKVKHVDGQVMLSATSITQGPLPPAQDFALYENALPGSADRIITMAEKQMEHRHLTENKLLNANIKLNYFGLFANIILGITPLICAVIIAINGYALAASLIGTGGILSFGGFSLYSMIKSKNNNE